MLLVLLALTSVSRADFQSGWYSWFPNGVGPHCTGRVADPINIVFYGQAAQSLNTRVTIQIIRDWNPADSAKQYASSHDVCSVMELEAISGTGDNRDHIRLNQTHEKTAAGDWATVGTPHYDRTFEDECGDRHVIPPNGFTAARADMIRAFTAAGYHFSRYELWGHDRAIQQCDGRWTASNAGYSGWVEVDEIPPSTSASSERGIR